MADSKVLVEATLHYQKLVDKFRETNTLEPCCQFTQIQLRLGVLRGIVNSESSNVYSQWSLVANLVETWSEEDEWRAIVEKSLKLKEEDKKSSEEGVFGIGHLLLA